MGVLDTAVDHRAEPYRAARTSMLAALARLETALDAAREGGGERAVTRHHARGKLLARERIELLVDRDSPLLELSPVAGWGTGALVGAAVVTAIGVVEDQVGVIIAHDPTVPAATGDEPGTDALVPGFVAKVQRAQQIALENRLPVICLAEDAGLVAGHGPDPHGAGQLAAGFARLAAARLPTTAVCFGVPPAGPAGAFDYTIAIRVNAGGEAVHLAEDERDALRRAREFARRPRRPYREVRATPPPPKHDPEDLLAVPASDPWEILARILDGSEFDEVEPCHGPEAAARCAGWGEVHGYPVAVLADATGGAVAAGEDEARKAARLVRLAARTATPLLHLAHGAGVPATLAGVAAEAGVPVLTVRVGRGSGQAAMAALARFRFAWPDAGEAPGADDVLARSGRLEDDGVIDPRDTRTVLGLCLPVIRP